MCIYTNNVFLRDLRYKGGSVLPDTLLPGISETRQDDQGPFLCGVAVPEQPAPALASETRSSPPARGPGEAAGAGNAWRHPPLQVTAVSPAVPASWCSGAGSRRAGGPRAPIRTNCAVAARRRRRLTHLSLSLSPGAGWRPWGAAQPPPEGSAESSGPEEAGGRGGRRLRTAFSAEQLSTLESSFQRQQYLGAAERRKLAGRMRLSEVQIKTWFQNRRMKLKRQLQELRTEPFCSPPLPYGPQSGVVPLPLTYVARPAPLPREGAASGGFTLAALPAPTLDLSSACRAQPVGFWAAPYFVGCRDPRAFVLGV
ncbi:LOW QUALITY PROTEIN: uncharacterized protein AAHN32_004161 [Aegotheles albertisi]